MINSTATCFKNLCKNINTTNNLLADKELKSTPLNKLKIMGSYASYSSSGSYYSANTSLDELKNNVLLQNRFIHLDVYYNIQNGEKIPIVRGKKNKNYLLFEDCCSTIQNYAWSSKILSSYPLFLFIYLRYDSINIDVSNKVADILIKYFSDNWPDIKYKNGFKNGNLATEPLENFINKVVILTNYHDDLSDKEIKDDESVKNKHRDNGFYLNELVHSYIKIYDSVTDIMNDNQSNFAALNFKNIMGNKLSSNQYNNLNDYKKELENKFLIGFSNYNNSQYVTKTYTFNILDESLSLFNVLTIIYYNVDDKSDFFDLLKKNMTFFTVKGLFMPIRHLKIFK